MMIKKYHLLSGLIIGISIFFISIFSREIGYCPPYSYSPCAAFFDGIAQTFIPSLAALLFSLITYWMREEIYVAWFRFARWWIPLSMVAIFLSPEYGSDWMYPVEKGTVALGTSSLFAAISLAIIAAKYIGRKR